jgi:hypothetical protein
MSSGESICSISESLRLADTRGSVGTGESSAAICWRASRLQSAYFNAAIARRDAKKGVCFSAVGIVDFLFWIGALKHVKRPVFPGAHQKSYKSHDY